jgi:hypothetical protein
MSSGHTLLYAAAVHRGHMFEKCVELMGLEPLAFWMQTSLMEVGEGRTGKSEP